MISAVMGSGDGCSEDDCCWRAMARDWAAANIDVDRIPCCKPPFDEELFPASSGDEM